MREILPHDLQIKHNGNIGNKMFQYVFMRGVQALTPNSGLSGFYLPEFNLSSSPVNLTGRVLTIASGHVHSPYYISSLLRRGIYDSVEFSGYVQRLEYYSSPENFIKHFLTNDVAKRNTYSNDGEILINVRGKEILKNTHPDYGPVPVSYFVKVAELSKRTPVIMGQLDDSEYSNAIRKAFVGCRFCPSKGPLSDFLDVQSARHVCIGVSSFSFLASWTSTRAQTIYMPIKGTFNPLQRPDVDLLPLNDERFKFFKFPVEKWHATTEQLSALYGAAENFRPILNREVGEMITY
jgi:hypothetical protein